MKTRQQILTENRLEDVLQARGVVLHGGGNEMSCKCPFHEDGTASMGVNIEKQVWTCHACGIGGSVIDYLSRADGVSIGDVLNRLGENGSRYNGRGSNGNRSVMAPANGKPKPDAPPPSADNISAIYDYLDQMGRVVYQVCRIQTPNPSKPCGYDKTFRQRRPDGKGGWTWNMNGVTRILYRLPEILNPRNEYVWVVEGERDVETVRSIGLAGTTNAGGAGKWCDAYSECLKGKNVVLCGDNDKPGKEHIEKVMESVEPHAKSIRKIQLPEQFKDITEFRESFETKEKFIESVMEMIDTAPVMLRGGTLPIKSMAEMESEYIQHVKEAKTGTVDLSKWIPSLRCVRPLVAGELVSIVGDTGSGKTYVLQHIAYRCQVPTLLFEIELPNSLTFERFVSLARKRPGREVFETYTVDGRMEYGDCNHVFTCNRSRIGPKEIESLILKSELKMGVRPSLVLVDYVQLVSGEGKSRYERMSGVAEELKIIAKNTGTVIVMSSQVSRDKERPEIGLHDAKESGAIENSSGVVIGLWRENGKPEVMNLKVLKNTKGSPSGLIQCRVDLGCMSITELSPISDGDVPRTNRVYDAD